MAELLSINDVKDICLGMGIDLEVLVVDDYRATLINLIEHCYRTERMSQFLAAYKEMRPEAAFWIEVD